MKTFLLAIALSATFTASGETVIVDTESAVYVSFCSDVHTEISIDGPITSGYIKAGRCGTVGLDIEGYIPDEPPENFAVSTHLSDQLGRSWSFCKLLSVTGSGQNQVISVSCLQNFFLKIP